jgi:hypothetical protein
VTSKTSRSSSRARAVTGTNRKIPKDNNNDDDKKPAAKSQLRKRKNGGVRFDDLMEPLPKRNRRGKSTKNQNIKNVTKPCHDFLETTEHDYSLIRKKDSPFDPSKYTTGVAEFDKENLEDVQHAVTYVTDIFQRLYVSEVRNGIVNV